MKDLLLSAEEDISLLDTTIRDITKDMAKVTDAYKEEIYSRNVELSRLSAKLAIIHEERRKHISKLVKAIELKLEAIICERLTLELLAKTSDRLIELAHVCKEGNYYIISYDRLCRSIRIYVGHSNHTSHYTEYLGNIAECTEVRFIKNLKFLLPKYRLTSGVPSDTKQLLALCSLLDIDC